MHGTVNIILLILLRAHARRLITPHIHLDCFHRVVGASKGLSPGFKSRVRRIRFRTIVLEYLSLATYPATVESFV